MKVQSRRWTLTLPLVLAACAARGQHTDVHAYDSGGKLTVGEIETELGNPATETRVFPALFDSFYAVNNPGFFSLAGDLPGSRDLGWDFQPMTVDSGPHTGYRSTLLYWNGVGAMPNFGPTPTQDYRLTLFGGSQGVAAGGTDSVVPGDIIDRTAGNGSIHQHRFFFLDDNGDGLNTSLPAAGVYLLAMTLRMEGLEDSDPFFFVWATPETSVLPAIQPAVAWVEDRVDSLVALGGDFNLDGLVDAADYTVWRDGLGSTYTPGHYDTWRANYGSVANDPSIVGAAVPEPSAVLGIAMALGLANAVPRRGS